MIISNGEPFLNLKVAAKAFYYDELFLNEPDVRHFEGLASWLDIYTFVNGICNIYTDVNPILIGELDRLPKKINGMCKIDVTYPSYEAQSFQGQKPKVKLIISKITKSLSSEYIGYSVVPIEEYINYDNYFSLSYVHLSEFINHAKEVGVDLNAIFLEEIISEDSTFKELKRLSKKLPSEEFNIKQAVNIYLKYFDGILEETIVQACELASARYDRMMKKTYVEANIDKEIDSTQYDLAENNIIELLTEKSATVENVKLLKSQLSGDWREALFLHKLSTDTTVIAELKQQISAQNKQINELKENTFPVMTPKLKAALKAQNEFWLTYDENHLPSQKSIKWFIENELGLNHLKTNRDAEELTRAIQPDNIKRK